MFFELCLQVELDDFIDSLYLAVGLGMVNTKIFAIELCAIIRNDLVGYTEMADDGFPNKFLDLLTGDHS